MKPEPGRVSKWGKVGTVSIVLFSVALCAAGLFYISTDIPSAASKYNENLSLAKTVGAVFSREDAVAMRKVPISENAYSLIQTFAIKIDALHVDFFRVETSDSGFLDEWKPFEKYLPTVLAASKRKYFIVDSDLKDPDSPPATGLPNLPKWSQAMCWLADISAKKSDLKTSRELLIAAAKLSIMFEHDPDFEAIRTRSEIAMAINHELSRLITSHGGDQSWQILIQEVLSILDRPYDLRPCYKFAHWLTLYQVQLSTGEIREPSFTDVLSGERFIPRYTKATMSRVHELYGKMLNQYPADIGDFSKIADLNKNLFESGDYHAMSLKAFYYSLPNYSGRIWEIRYEEAQRNAVIQALAIKKGNLDPTKGLPIKGRNSFDLDGNLIRLRKLPKGWVVYSVGNDGKDNGGDNTKRFNSDWVVDLSK